MKKTILFVLIVGIIATVLASRSLTSVDPYTRSVQGMTWVRVAYGFLSKGPTFRYLKYKNDPLIDGKLPYMVFPNKNSKRWALYVPGIFSYLDSAFVRYFSETLHDQNFNVILIPNTFTSDYLRSRPKINSGMIEQEAQLFCSLVAKVRNQENISTPMPIIGVSYGGLLASAMSQNCSSFFDQLTLVSPPYNLQSSMAKVFRLLNDVQKENPEIISANESLMYLKGLFVSQAHFKSLFARFFLDGLYYTMFLQKESLSSNKIKTGDLKYGTPQYRQWQKNTDLKSYFIKQNHVAIKTNSKQFDLLHWLTDISIPTSIYASLDDPINEAQQWETLRFKAKNVELNLKTYGGHLGFVRSDDFSDYLQKQLQRSNP